MLVIDDLHALVLVHYIQCVYIYMNTYIYTHTYFVTYLCTFNLLSVCCPCTHTYLANQVDSD